MKIVMLFLKVFSTVILTSGLLRAEDAPEETLAFQTQRAIDPILQRMGFLRATFLGNEFWQYLIFFIILTLSIFAAKILDRYLTARAGWVAEKSGNRLISQITDKMRGPFELVVVILGVRMGAAFFYMTEEMRAVVSNSIEFLIAVTVTYVIIKTVDIAAAHFEPRFKSSQSQLDAQLLPVLRKALKTFIVSIAALVIIQNLGYNVLSLLTGLGIGGLAIALAAQQTLSNFFGSIAIFSDKPFSIGDRVQLDKYDGMIETIGLRSTRIRTLDGTLVTVPNSKVSDSYIDNISKRPWIKKVYTLGVTYDTGFDRMKEALEAVREIYRSHPSTDNAWVYFTDFGPHSLDILIIHWCKHLVFEEYLIATEDINLKIMQKFKEIGVKIAFPTRTLHIKNEAAVEEAVKN